MTTTSNGIDLDVLNGTVDGIRAHPDAGRVRVRTSHRWDDGFAVDGRTEEIDENGDVSKRTHSFRTDWPQPFGRDSGPTPGAESILAAVGACVATTYIMKATAQSIPIDELEVTVDGKIDLQGLFELDDDVRQGLTDVNVDIRVHSPADDAVLEELGRIVTRTSPALDVLTTPVPVNVRVGRSR